MMKKGLLYAFVLMICVVAGCKKDGQKSKIYLVKQQITDASAEGLPLDTANYTYDDQNRIIKITDGTHPNMVTFTIAYDSENRVTTASKYADNGNQIIEFDFFYNTGSSGYIFHGSSLADTAYFTFNSKKQVSVINTKHSGSQQFTYDGGGNVATTTAVNVDGSIDLGDETSFAYDNQKNPFSDIPANNYFFMYIVKIGNPSTLINNVVVRDADRYTYKYNSAGFPTSGSIATLTATSAVTLYVYYNYIVK